jgi:hypothetical protein
MIDVLPCIVFILIACTYVSTYIVGLPCNIDCYLHTIKNRERTVIFFIFDIENSSMYIHRNSIQMIMRSNRLSCLNRLCQSM